jgi:hypothetical protein
MQDEKYKKILEKDYQKLLKEVVDYIVLNDDQPKAFELLGILKKAVSFCVKELKADLKLANFYQEAILKLSFIALPSLDEKAIISLFKNYFCHQFNIEGYDIKRKINAKLISIILLSARDQFKISLKQALLENDEKVSNKSGAKTVKEYLQDYVSKIGIDSHDKLERAQYIMEIKNSKDINNQEYERLKLLFNIFDFINSSSEQPEGFEEEYPVIVKGKLNIFRKGALEPVTSKKDIEEILNDYNYQPESDDNTEDALIDHVDQASIPNQEVQAISSPSRVAELEKIIKNYSPASLEYKAINQEISRLKKSETKESNAKE